MSTAADQFLDPVSELLLAARRARASSPLPRRVRLARWLTAAAFLAAAVGFLLLPSGRSLDLGILALLTVAYALAVRVQFEVGSGFAIPTELVFVPMLFMLPGRIVPLAVAAGLVLGHLPEVLRRRTDVTSLAVAAGSGWFALAPAALVVAAGEPQASTGRWPLLLALLVVQFAADFASTAAREWAALSIRPSALVEPMRWVFAVDLLLAPVGFTAAVAGSEATIGVLMPLTLLVLFRRYARERTAGLDSALELSSAYRGTAHLLGDVIEADDSYTGSHSRDVVLLTLSVADALDLSQRDRRDAEFAALLHDVGKIKIPDAILNKPGPLTAAERALMETHTLEGERLLQTVGGQLGTIGRIIRSCHERWDGAGYPDGLAGAEIPLVSRIVSCCDALSAMTTDRPYRTALPLEAALAELESCAGSQFDPTVAAVLVALQRARLWDSTAAARNTIRAAA